MLQRSTAGRMQGPTADTSELEAAFYILLICSSAHCLMQSSFFVPPSLPHPHRPGGISDTREQR